METRNDVRPAKVGRRSFLKMAAAATAFGSTGALANTAVTKTASNLKEAHSGSKLVRSVCSACSVGCGIVAEVKNGVWLRQEMAIDHPISQGGYCCKGASMIDLVRSEVRVKHPMEKVNGEWKRISWDEAFNKISKKLSELRSKNGPDSTMFLGSAKLNSEQAYYFRKFAAFYGTNNIDHQARI